MQRIFRPGCVTASGFSGSEIIPQLHAALLIYLSSTMNLDSLCQECQLAMRSVRLQSRLGRLPSSAVFGTDYHPVSLLSSTILLYKSTE